ncbi:galactoside O-acetyltransferase [Rhodanobacter sp. C06]|uniref:acyltransferase n=1 Tax=Rhodanobacter sp. C06 TaxID=1945854 RepID=UPI0009850DFA|nr:acyltransferase [Rhodanobacter sp. C06]OOG36083.1 galactoside O-acetyltransferase [Rhodanobacter sp. C06]OOG36204.1 galactoside O-acetyltransferase [Rhodanobacter sp. C06]
MNNPFDPGYFSDEQLVDFGFKKVGKNVRIARSCTIIGLNNIELGDNVRIDGYCSIIAAGNGFTKIGSFVHIAGYCGLYAGSGIVLEDFSGLSAGVRIYTATDDYSGRTLTNPTVPEKYLGVTSGPVILMKHVIVGTGSVILPGVTANEGVSVGALSLITKDLDAWSIYAGMPARRLRDRSKDLLSLEKSLLAELDSELNSEVHDG